MRFAIFNRHTMVVRCIVDCAQDMVAIQCKEDEAYTVLNTEDAEFLDRNPGVEYKVCAGRLGCA